MANVNKVILLGRLGKDPEVRYTQDGKAVATLSLATSETYKDHAGVKQERTEWHKVILWERKAEIAEQYLRKGDQAYIEGRLQTRKWTDNNNVERYSTEVVGDRMQLLGGQREGSRDSQPSAPQHNRNSSGGSGRGNGGGMPPMAPMEDFPDDEIPFGTNADLDGPRRRLLARVRF